MAGDSIRPMESRSLETSMIENFSSAPSTHPQGYNTLGHRGYGQKVLIFVCFTEVPVKILFI